MKNKGFSLVELVVSISILAVLTMVLAPTLVAYTERSRAGKDIAAIDEIAEVILLSATDQNVYDELTANRIDGNVSCYIDQSTEESCSNAKVDVQITREGDVVQYIYNDDARKQDEMKFYAAGRMRGVTITFERRTDPADGYIYISDGVINKFSDCAIDIEACPYLCRQIRLILGEKIDLSSQTYRNSEVTVFIRMGSSEETTILEQEPIQIYSQFSGTNVVLDNVPYERAEAAPITNVNNAEKGVIDSIKDVINENEEEIKNAVNGAVNDANAWIDENGDEIKDAVSGAIDGANNWVNENQDEIQDVVDGANGWIEDNKDQIGDAVGGIVDTIVGGSEGDSGEDSGSGSGLGDIIGGLINKWPWK